MRRIDLSPKKAARGHLELTIILSSTRIRLGLSRLKLWCRSCSHVVSTKRSLKVIQISNRLRCQSMISQGIKWSVLKVWSLLSKITTLQKGDPSVWTANGLLRIESARIRLKLTRSRLVCPLRRICAFLTTSKIACAVWARAKSALIKLWAVTESRADSKVVKDKNRFLKTST